MPTKKKAVKKKVVAKKPVKKAVKKVVKKVVPEIPKPTLSGIQLTDNDVTIKLSDGTQRKFEIQSQGSKRLLKEV